MTRIAIVALMFFTSKPFFSANSMGSGMSVGVLGDRCLGVEGLGFRASGWGVQI